MKHLLTNAAKSLPCIHKIPLRSFHLNALSLGSRIIARKIVRKILHNCWLNDGVYLWPALFLYWMKVLEEASCENLGHVPAMLQ